MFIALAICDNGFDLSYYQGDVSQDSMNCLRNNGMNFAIFQAQIGGTFNTHAISDYQRARAAGIPFVDFYIFPTTAIDPRVQVRDTINRLKGAGVINGNQVWLDIENHDLFYSSCADNQWFVNEMLDEMRILLGHQGVGVYSNWVQWDAIMCGWTGASSYPNWYPHYDDWQSFNDYKPFGGWSKPAIKQYTNSHGICGTTIDSDWYPGY